MNVPSASTREQASALAGGIQADAVAEFNAFVADVEDLVKSTTNLTGDDLAKAKAKLGARVSAARDSVAEMGGAVADRAREGARSADGFVHQNPWPVIGIAAAVGLLVGFALARSK